MVTFWFSIGCLLAGLAVAAGAFGAHALRQRLPVELLSVFETGVRYQMYHALGIITVAFAQSRWPTISLQISGWLFLCWDPSFLRKPLWPLPERKPNLGCFHTVGRFVLPGWMGVAGLLCMAGKDTTIEFLVE